LAITITLEEPYEIIIYCSRYGCDWRIRDPKTKRFLAAPPEIFFICHKRKSMETRKGTRRVRIEAEMQGVCYIDRRWVREHKDTNEIEKALKSLELLCNACEIVSRCIGDVLLEYLVETATVDSVAWSFALQPDTCYIHIEEQYGTRFYEREYAGGMVDCFV
jgi:hypothetical protein